MISTERNAADVRFDRWLARAKIIIAFAFGLLSGVSTMLIAGDTRYARRAEVDLATQTKLQEHIAEDKATFATKTDLATHQAQLGHPSTVEINMRQDQRISRLESNMAWVANALYAIARKSNIALAPPPELRDPRGELP